MHVRQQRQTGKNLLCIVPASTFASFQHNRETMTTINANAETKKFFCGDRKNADLPLPASLALSQPGCLACVQSMPVWHPLCQQAWEKLINSLAFPLPPSLPPFSNLLEPALSAVIPSSTSELFVQTEIGFVLDLIKPKPLGSSPTSHLSSHRGGIHRPFSFSRGKKTLPDAARGGA